MFLGLNTQGSCSDFAGAQRVLERMSRTDNGKARAPKEFGFPLGGHNKSVTWVRELPDGEIAFRLYQTDVVVWSPDNTVYVENYGTSTTSKFAHRFLPERIHLHYPTERRGMSGGANTIGFRAGGEFHICQGEDVVQFYEDEDGWRPERSMLNAIKLPTMAGAAKTRKLYADLNLRDFAIWLEVAPAHLQDVEHIEYDLERCINALADRDFRSAAEHLPLIKEPSGFGTAERMRPLGVITPYGFHVTMGSVAKLKLALQDWENLIGVEAREVWDRKAYDRGMSRVREMDALGLSVYGLGPQ